MGIKEQGDEGTTGSRLVVLGGDGGAAGFVLVRLVDGNLSGDPAVLHPNRPRSLAHEKRVGFSGASTGHLRVDVGRWALGIIAVDSLGATGGNICSRVCRVLFFGAESFPRPLESMAADHLGSRAANVLCHADDGAALWCCVSPDVVRTGEWVNWELLCRKADRLLLRQCFINHCQREGGAQMSQSTISTVMNGVDVERLGQTIQAIQKDPGLAKSQFRATNRWVNGGHNRSSIQGFYAAGQEDMSRTKPFVLDADEPPALLGQDKGANPVEFVLHALAACVTTSLVYHAAARGIKLESVESQLEGDLDLRGFLGLSDQVRRGYKEIRVKFNVKSDASPEQLEELTKFSPVYDIVSSPVPVSIQVETR